MVGDGGFLCIYLMSLVLFYSPRMYDIFKRISAILTKKVDYRTKYTKRNCSLMLKFR